jgi:hypothetical protein
VRIDETCLRSDNRISKADSSLNALFAVDFGGILRGLGKFPDVAAFSKNGTSKAVAVIAFD